MRRPLLFALLVLTVAGCGKSREQEQLESVLSGVVRTRDKDAAIAEHLDEYRTEVKRLEEDLAIVDHWNPQSDAGLVIAAAEKSSGATVGYAKSDFGPILTVSGKGGGPGAMDALDRLTGGDAGLILEQIHITPAEWSATLSLRGTIALDSPDEPAPLPPPGLFSGRACKDLRERIAREQREVAELDRLIGPVKAFEKSKARLQRELDALHSEPDRLWLALPAIKTLFARENPVFVSGEVKIGNPSHIAGALATGVDAGALADRVKGSWEVTRFESGAADLREILPRKKTPDSSR